MKLDTYCVALIVLILFLVYIDQTNNVEGFGAELSELDTPPIGPYSGSPPQQRQQDYEPIGLKPQKVAMKPPVSMGSVMGLVESAGSPLASLDSAFEVMGPSPVPTQIPADVRSFGSRVGGPDNTGDESLGSAMGSAMAPPPSDASSRASKSLEVHMVYAPWCGWSKKALPDFERLESEFNGTQMGDYSVTVLKHDSDTAEGKAVAKEHGVKGFPTHFVIKDGQKMDARGRSFDELASQIKELTA